MSTAFLNCPLLPYKWQSKIDPFDLVLSFNLWLNPYSFFILQTITLTGFVAQSCSEELLRQYNFQMKKPTHKIYRTPKLPLKFEQLRKALSLKSLCNKAYWNLFKEVEIDQMIKFWIFMVGYVPDWHWDCMKLACINFSWNLNIC